MCLWSAVDENAVRYEGGIQSLKSFWICSNTSVFSHNIIRPISYTDVDAERDNPTPAPLWFLPNRVWVAAFTAVCVRARVKTHHLCQNRAERADQSSISPFKRILMWQMIATPLLNKGHPYNTGQVGMATNTITTRFHSWFSISTLISSLNLTGESPLNWVHHPDIIRFRFSTNCAWDPC